jgi:hypothetical protein
MSELLLWKQKGKLASATCKSEDSTALVPMPVAPTNTMYPYGELDDSFRDQP